MVGSVDPIPTSRPLTCAVAGAGGGGDSLLLLDVMMDDDLLLVVDDDEFGVVEIHAENIVHHLPGRRLWLLLVMTGIKEGSRNRKESHKKDASCIITIIHNIFVTLFLKTNNTTNTLAGW